ncbi:hypothetical protein MNBD_GAMMA04-1245, partial [hydrothermal vent metagenome]
MSWMNRLKQLSHRITRTPYLKQAHVNAPILSEHDIHALIEVFSQLPTQITQAIMANCPLSHATRQGEQHSPFTGSGFEYEESRPYQVGDEIRRINWPLMAKTGLPYTKYFQEDRQANWFVLVDHRCSMRFGTQKRLKATQATRIAGYFAWLAQQSATPIVGARLSEQLEQTPTLEGRGSYERIMTLFSQPCPPCSTWNGSPSDSLNTALLTLHAQIKAGTRLILISDFQGINQHTTEQLVALQQRAMITAICIQDPVEHTLPNIQHLQLHGMHSPKTLNLNNPEKRHAYQTWMQQHQYTRQTHL